MYILTSQAAILRVFAGELGSELYIFSRPARVKHEMNLEAAIRLTGHKAVVTFTQNAFYLFEEEKAVVHYSFISHASERRNYNARALTSW